MAVSQKQRDFLVDKVKENRNKLRKEIEEALPNKPDISHIMLLAVMSDKFELKSNEEIREAIRTKAGNDFSKRTSFISVPGRWDEDKDPTINLKLEALFEVPESYAKELAKWEEAVKLSKVQIDHIDKKSDTLITRITLASTHQFEQLINEVNAMGSLSINDMVVQKLGPKEARLALAALDEEDQKLLN